MKKSLSLLMIIVLFGVAFYFLLPNMKDIKSVVSKRNVVSSAKIYGDEIKSMWNSDALYCSAGFDNYKAIIGIPHQVYYVLVGSNKENTSLPFIKVNKVDDIYYGYVKIDYSGVEPKFSVFLTDEKYSVSTDSSYSMIGIKDVKEGKLSFTFDSSYSYCKEG